MYRNKNIICILVFLICVVYAQETAPILQDDCDCIGIKSITFRYISDNQHEEVTVVVIGQSAPTQFESIKNNDLITVFGTFGNNHVLGPLQVTLKVFPYGADVHATYPFEQQTFNVDCVNSPETLVKEGDVKGSIEVVNVVDLNEGTVCEHDCPFTIALAIDASGSITAPEDGGDPNNEQLIKSMLKEEIVAYLTGVDGQLAVYSFATNAYEDITYTDLTSAAGIQAINSAIDGIVFQSAAPAWYTNWEDLFSLMKFRAVDEQPDLVIFLSDGNPTIHNHSPFVVDDYADDITAGINAANLLKSNGNTRIISIAVGDNVTAANLQAISGPIADQDYFITDDYSDVVPILHQILPFACCSEDKDECGVCYGDGTTCAGCDGIPNSGTEVDVCGVCGGDGTPCAPPPCNHSYNITVIEETSFDIVDHHSTFEFKYHTNYFAGTTVVLGFEPYEETTLRHRDTCSNKDDDYISDYCDLFVIDSSDVWQHEIVDQTVYYSANFTLYDLLGCQDTLGNGPIIQVSEDKTHYTGYLYGAVVRANDCVGANDSDYVDEVILFQTHYRFEIWIEEEGVLSTLIMVTPIEFEGNWIRNIWLQSGDVIVEFETLVNEIDDDDEAYETYLGDAEIVVAEETGVPFQLEYVDIDCTDDGDSSTCRQIWQMRTYNAVGVIDFSGYKPVRYTVYTGHHAQTTVKLNFHLSIKKTTDPTIQNHLYPYLQVYKDRYLQYPYTPDSEYFIDCADVYAEIGFANHYGVIGVDKVLLCTGENGDPLPYDSQHPETTGCNTPDIDIIQYTLYNGDDDETSTNEFEFEFIQDPPSPEDLYLLGFKFTARKLSDYKQLIQVHWTASNYAADTHVSSLLEGIPVALFNEKRNIHRELALQKQHYDTHKFAYPKKYYRSPVSTLKENFNDDFLFSFDYDSCDRTNYGSYYVSCAYGYTWDGDYCVNTYHSYAYSYGSSFVVWAFIAIIIIIIAVWYCYSVPNVTQTQRYTHYPDCNHPLQRSPQPLYNQNQSFVVQSKTKRVFYGSEY